MIIHTISSSVSYYFILFQTISYCFISIEECFAIISPLPYRNSDNDLNVDNFNIVRDMDLVMFERPEWMFKVKLKLYCDISAHIIENLLIFFKRVAPNPDDEMHRMENMF